MNSVVTTGAHSTPDVALASRVWVVLHKELRELFRDRRTLRTAIISPLVITPTIMIAIGLTIAGQQKKAQSQTFSIGVIGKAPGLTRVLDFIPRVTMTSVSLSQAEAAIKERRLNAVILLPDDADQRIASNQTVPIAILKDAGNTTSQSAADRVESALNTIGLSVARRRLKSMGVPSDAATPFKVEEKPISRGGSSFMLLLSSLLPYILTLSGFAGGIYAAFDQVAGEKERGTLETLLVSPATRRDIVLGKFGAVLTVCMLSSALSVVGMIIPFKVKGTAFAAMASSGIQLSPGALGITVLVVMLLSVLFAGALLAVSTVARNQREAQSYLMPLYMLIMLPTILTTVINGEVSKSMALIPLMGSCMVIKQALGGLFDPRFITLALGSSVVYAGLALFLSIRLFERESVLLKT